MYSLGRLACQFYESQTAKSQPLEDLLEQCEAENDQYLESMVTQELIMDKILVHMWLAGSKERQLSDVVELLSTFNISPASLERIKASHTLLSVDSLIAQLAEDYRPTILSKCRLIAELDGKITEEEQSILNKLEGQSSVKV
jgi:hypothetical protein